MPTSSLERCTLSVRIVKSSCAKARGADDSPAFAMAQRHCHRHERVFGSLLASRLMALPLAFSSDHAATSRSHSSRADVTVASARRTAATLMSGWSRRSRRTCPAVWQRCLTHYAANLMSICPKSMWPAVKAMLHSVYD